MMKIKHLLIIVLVQTVVFIDSLAQLQSHKDYSQVLNLIGKHGKHNFFLHEKPTGFKVQGISIDRVNALTKFRGNDSIPEKIIFELLEKAQMPDTNKWKQVDFPNKVIINDETTAISFTEESKRIGLIDKTELEFLEDDIEFFNLRKLRVVSILYLSRPIFSSYGDYVLIQYDTCGHSGGTGGVLLLKKINNEWTYYLRLKSWDCF